VPGSSKRIGSGRAAACLLLAGALPAGAVCINEVLYDPAGADAGREWVELHHAGTQPVDLAGWRLEAGNGARPGDWRAQWEGRPGDRIVPGGFFLIAGELAEVPADARAPLALQNGPDGVRLRSALGTVADCVGWGDLEYAEYYETRPAPRVPAGSSLARTADGVDSDDNAADFRPAARCTPGQPNAPALLLLLEEVRVEPPVLDGCHPGLLRVTIANGGTRPLALDDLRWEIAAPLLRVRPAGERLGELAPGETRALSWELEVEGAGGAGSLRVAVQGPSGAGGVADILVRAGAGDVLISEIQYEPRPGECEWVELWNRSGESVDLGGWGLRDASGRTTIVVGPAPIEPGRCRVAVESEAAFTAVFPRAAEFVLARRGAWPALNNSVDAERGYADEVVLIDADGLAVDYARYMPGGLDGRGVSLERWVEGGRLVDPCALIPCPASAGATPGEPPEMRSGLSGEGGALAPEPLLFFPDRPGAPRYCRIALSPAAAGPARVTADVFGLDGRRVATLVAGARAGGPLLLSWDGTSAGGDQLPTGLYLIRALWRTSSPAAERSLVRSVALVRD